MVEELGVDIKIPRQSSRHMRRQNFSDAGNILPVDYWNGVINIQVLDSFNGDLGALRKILRFSQEALVYRREQKRP